ncbi:MAG: mechanosensitive ion channel family protein [Gammaproteobacteria bacterium]|nr:mechanosensitive ion channel family protein [Gammaproteobacteria bacterium]
MRNIRTALFLVIGLALVGPQAGAQDSGSPAAERLDIPIDAFDRGTPRRSGDGFMAAADAGDYETAAEYLDLRNLYGDARKLTGAQLARRLDVIIERAAWEDVHDLIDNPAGRGNDGLPDYRDSIGVVLDEDRGKEYQLYMQRVPRGDGVFIWKVSNATVSLIPELYDAFGYPEAIENFRRSLPQVSFLGYELFKWVITFVVGGIVYCLVFLIALVIRRTLGDPHSPSHRRIFRFLILPAGLWLVVLAMSTTAGSLGRGAAAEAIRQASPVPVLVTIWFLFAGVNLVREIYATRLEQRGRPGAVVLLRPATNAIKLLLAIGAVLVYLDQLGINITTVLAGLGVGGIAVALALQKPMEDVFGAITLYTQQPIRVGDFCRVGKETGTIEEIGLRTTRIRTLANTVIAIPNAHLANEAIDNISARRKIWYRPILRLKYDTTPQQIEQILEAIRKLLGSHDRVLKDNYRARFKEIANDALLVEVYAYLNTTDWAEYLGIAEELNMHLLEIVNQAGTSLGLPAQALYVEQGAPGPSNT